MELGSSVLSATAKMLEHLQAGTRITPGKVPSQLVRMWDGDGGEKIYQYVKDISCSALHRFSTFFHNEPKILVSNQISKIPKCAIYIWTGFSLYHQDCVSLLCDNDVSVTGLYINWAWTRGHGSLPHLILNHVSWLQWLEISNDYEISGMRRLGADSAK